MRCDEPVETRIEDRGWGPSILLRTGLRVRSLEKEQEWPEDGVRRVPTLPNGGVIQIRTTGPECKPVPGVSAAS